MITADSLLRYHLYHPIVCGSRWVAGQEEQRAGLAIYLNRHLAALVTQVQYDLVDERWSRFLRQVVKVDPMTRER
jgi:hypothetical protein